MQAANETPQGTVCRSRVLSLLHLSNYWILFLRKPHLQEHAFLLGKFDKDKLARENEAFLCLVEKLAPDFPANHKIVYHSQTNLFLGLSWLGGL